MFHQTHHKTKCVHLLHKKNKTQTYLSFIWEIKSLVKVKFFPAGMSICSFINIYVIRNSARHTLSQGKYIILEVILAIATLNMKCLLLDISIYVVAAIFSCHIVLNSVLQPSLQMWSHKIKIAVGFTKVNQYITTELKQNIVRQKNMTPLKETKLDGRIVFF